MQAGRKLIVADRGKAVAERGTLGDRQHFHLHLDLGLGEVAGDGAGEEAVHVAGDAVASAGGEEAEPRLLEEVLDARAHVVD